MHIVLPVFERHTGRPPVDEDGQVDPELTRLYREAVAASVLWAALDPGLVQQGLAFFDGGFEARRAWMPVRTERLGWTWGTQFNPSPLGYELYLLQYLRLDRRTFELALKHGRPMKNNGVRLSAARLIELEGKGIGLGAEVEVWDQDVHGFGISGSASAEVPLRGGLGAVGWLGYKTEGYVLGRSIDSTPFGALGLAYSFEHGLR